MFEIILGATKPDMVLVIDSDTTIICDILLMNNARLEIRGCNVNYRGALWLILGSELIIDDADFILLQEYI